MPERVIEPYAAPGTVLCTEEFVSELDEMTKPLFTQLAATSSETPGLMLGRGGTAVIRKNEQDEPIEARLFQAALS